MTTINESGFLSEQVAQWTKKIRVEYAEYFRHCEEVNKFARETMMGLQVHNKCRPETVVGLLFTRALSNFRGILLLAEKGMINECKALLRCLLEVMFALVAVAKDARVADELVDADTLLRIDALKAFRRQAEAGEKFYEDESIKAQINHLQEELASEMTRKDIKKITLRYLAQKAGLITTYDSEYKMLCVTVHVNVRDLEQYLDVDDDGNIRSFLWGPDAKEIDTVLLTGAETMLCSLDGMLETLKKPITTDHQELWDRHNKLAKSFYARVTSL